MVPLRLANDPFLYEVPALLKDTHPCQMRLVSNCLDGLYLRFVVVDRLEYASVALRRGTGTPGGTARLALMLNEL